LGIPLSLHAVGDIAPRRSDPASIFASVADALRDSDLRIGHLECPLSTRGTPAPNAKLAMRSDPAVAGALRKVGFDALSVAGNHALDFGAVALADTLTALREHDIATCGVGANLEDARTPAIIQARGRRVALLSYCCILPVGYAAERARAGCAPLRAYTHFHHVEPDQPGTPPRVLTFTDQSDLDALVADVKAARTRAEIVLLSIHWGLHFTRATLADYQRVVARAAIDAGAHAILGHHPHVLKAIEVYRGRPIFYSLGNFAIEQPHVFNVDIQHEQSFQDITRLSTGWQPNAKFITPPDTRHTIIARLEFDDVGDVTASFMPCRIDDDSVPVLLGPGDPAFDEVIAFQAAVTEEVGIATTFTREGYCVRIGA
jgi:poly-gamma-glutamate capsule biosynthesis protein CapA/YwtB (metallophosphatase superfamily)